MQNAAGVIFAALLLLGMAPAATIAHGGAQDPSLAGPPGSDSGSGE